MSQAEGSACQDTLQVSHSTTIERRQQAGRALDPAPGTGSSLSPRMHEVSAGRARLGHPAEFRVRKYLCFMSQIFSLSGTLQGALSPKSTVAVCSPQESRVRGALLGVSSDVQSPSGNIISSFQEVTQHVHKIRSHRLLPVCPPGGPFSVTWRSLLCYSGDRWITGQVC